MQEEGETGGFVLNGILERGDVAEELIWEWDTASEVSYKGAHILMKGLGYFTEVFHFDVHILDDSAELVFFAGVERELDVFVLVDVMCGCEKPSDGGGS